MIIQLKQQNSLLTSHTKKAKKTQMQIEVAKTDNRSFKQDVPSSRENKH